MWFIQWKWNSPYLFPSVFVFGTIIFHIIRAIAGYSMKECQDKYWLMETPPPTSFTDLYELVYGDGKPQFKFVWDNV